MARRLNEALSRFRRPAGRPVGNGGFRAATEERLRGLERELVEVKARVNGLIFVVMGVVITQVVLKLVG